MNLKNKKILITGANGFIGTHLKSKLEGHGANIDSYDLSKKLDIRNIKTLTRFIKKEYFALFHLAGYSGSERSGKNTNLCFSINTFATAKLIDLIEKYSPNTKLILSSSRLEYGVPQYIPVDEKHATLPNSFYGLSKLLATEYAMTKKITTVIFRTSNVYGPDHHFKFKGYNVINYFINSALKNKKLIVFGRGNQLRDYIYIDDLIEAFIVSLNSRKTTVFNLGYGKGIKFKDMAKKITKIVGSGKIQYQNWPETWKDVETEDYISDISKIKKELNYYPKISWDKGIAKTLNSYK